jgi:hypothetical protein
MRQVRLIAHQSNLTPYFGPGHAQIKPSLYFSAQGSSIMLAKDQTDDVGQAFHEHHKKDETRLLYIDMHWK